MKEKRLLLVALTLTVGQLGCQPAPREPGLKWTKRTATGINLSTVAWSGSQFVAVGCCSVMTSPDGLRWKVAVEPVGEGEVVRTGQMAPEWGLNRVTWGGSQFLAVGRVVERPGRPARALILTSPDGVTWTERSAPTSAKDLQDVAWSGDRFVAVAGASVWAKGDAILTSRDGVTWSTHRLPVEGRLSAVTWADSQFMAVGGKRVLFTSPDGVTWTERSAPAEGLNDVAWSGDRFVAVSSDEIFTSPDGVTWSAHRLPVRGFWKAVTWGGSQFVAVGDAAIVTSPDGIIWTQRPAPARSELSDVAWSGTRFVAVGALRRGWFADYTTVLIITSP